MFSWISLKDLFIYSLRTTVIFVKTILKSFTFVSSMLKYLEPVVVRLLLSSFEISS